MKYTCLYWFYFKKYLFTDSLPEIEQKLAGQKRRWKFLKFSDYDTSNSEDDDSTGIHKEVKFIFSNYNDMIIINKINNNK